MTEHPEVGARYNIDDQCNHLDCIRLSGYRSHTHASGYCSDICWCNIPSIEELRDG